MTEKPEKEKTYKREVAIAMLLFLAVFFVWGVYNPEASQASRFLTLPIFTFAGGAYSLDAFSKQLNWNK